MDSFKYLKLSNVKFGPKEIKNFDTSYKKQYGMEIEDKYANAAKSPQPFVVNEPEKLNTLGVRYNGINSNYQRDFDAKRDGKREALKPPSLFKDLNIQLIKNSNYKEAFSPRTNEVRTSRKGRLQG